jgi:hypothetical protein
MDPVTAAIQRVITLQYNPDTLSRTLQPQAVASNGDRSGALRVQGPPVEIIKLEAEIDATDQLEFPEQNQNVAQNGIAPQLAALETILYPASANIQSNNALAQSGTLEIIPMEQPLALFVWSKNRIVPVRLTEYGVTEEAFDTLLNPTRAKVSLGLRVLSVNDLPFSHKGSSLYMMYQQQKEKLAQLAPGGTLSALGISGIP